MRESAKIDFINEVVLVETLSSPTEKVIVPEQKPFTPEE